MLESTFDINILKGLKSEQPKIDGSYPIKIYTIGGHTWVQEVGFLHGVPPRLYGSGYPYVNLFVPGHIEGRIAPQLSLAGYSTNTVSANSANFYGQGDFHKALGIKHFYPSEETGFTTPDIVFYKKALQLMNGPENKFIFITTIAQHSPHRTDLKRDNTICSDEITDAQCSIIQDYVGRQNDSIAAIREFLLQLKERKKRSIVLFLVITYRLT